MKNPTYISELKGNTREFALDCYDCRTIRELSKDSKRRHNALECRLFKVTPDQWKLALDVALSQKIADKKINPFILFGA